MKKCSESERKTRQELLDLLKTYGFFGFLHTAPFENFEKIFKMDKFLHRIAWMKQEKRKV